MSWIKQNWFKIGLLILGIFIALAFWQNLVVIPREKESQQKSKESMRQLDLSFCLTSAESIYQSYWSAQCEAEGKPSTCQTLSSYHAEAAEKIKQQEKDNCFQRYK